MVSGMACLVSFTALSDLPAIVISPPIAPPPTNTVIVLTQEKIIKHPPINQPSAQVIMTPKGQCLGVDRDNKTLIRTHCGRQVRFLSIDDKIVWQTASNRHTGNNRLPLTFQGDQCLDIAGENRNDGVMVIAYLCQPNKLSQGWYQKGGQIKSMLNHKCLDSRDRVIKVRSCDNSDYQQFIMQ